MTAGSHKGLPGNTPRFSMRVSSALKSPTLKECGAFGIAEVVSMGTSLLVVGAAQLIPDKVQKPFFRTMGKILEPYFLDPFESIKAKVCKLEECQTNPDKNRQDRAEDMARLVTIFGSSWIIAMAAKLKTRRFLNESFGAPEDMHMPKLSADASFVKKVAYHAVPWVYWSPEERLIFAADEGVHYGSVILMNNKLAPATDEMIRGATKVIQKITGFNEKKSREVADMLIIWEAPNVLGMATGFAAIAGKHKLGLPQSSKVLSTIFGGVHEPSHG